MNKVCYKCPDRYPACHDYCERYQEEKRQNEEIKAARAKDQELKDAYYESQTRMIHTRPIMKHKKL